MVIIYKISCKANNKDYIGITVDFRRRLAIHWHDAFIIKKQTVLCRAIRKYGKEQFTVTKINNVKTWDEACNKEMQYIHSLGTKIPHGFNMTDGGGGLFGFKASKETRLKHSKIHKGLHVGEKNHSSKLSDQEIIDIRRQYKEESISQHQIAKNYGISQIQVRRIINNESWSHIHEGALKSTEIKEKAQEHSRSKLTPEKVIEIRKRYKKENIFQYQLAEEYGVSKVTILETLVGKSWTHIHEGILTPLEIRKRRSEIQKGVLAGNKNGQAKLTESNIIEIRDLYKTGQYSYKQLAENFNTCKGNIANIIKRKTWTHI